MRPMLQHRAPAARPGVSIATAIRVNRDRLHRSLVFIRRTLPIEAGRLKGIFEHAHFLGHEPRATLIKKSHLRLLCAWRRSAPDYSRMES
jgi:hypothetical protein